MKKDIRFLILFFIVISLAQNSFGQNKKAFLKNLRQSGLEYIEPDNFNEVSVRENGDLYYNYAIAYSQDSFEVRYTIMPLKPLLKDYEASLSDTSRTVLNPNKYHKSMFIANILKCRPPGNRDPRPEESAECRPYLRRQIALVRPRVILAVGRIAAQDLLESDEPIGRLRTRPHSLPGADIPVVVTYHPAYLLRSPGQKRKAWQDLCRARELLTASGT